MDIINKRTDIYVDGVLIRARLIDTTQTHPRILCFPFIETGKNIADIGLHTSLILEDRIEDKERKTKRIHGIKWCGEKWLAIVNKYPLANTDNYLRAIEEINIIHTFSHIFLIEDHHKVTSLFGLSL